MSNELRVQIDQLVTMAVHMGGQADEMLERALDGLGTGDTAMLEQVVAADDQLDRRYERVQHGVLTVVALHGPVGRDLRLLTGLIHVSLHVERMGDYAVGVARTAERASALPADEDLVEQLGEMGRLAREVCRTALRSFVAGDADMGRTAAALDDEVDRLNGGIFRRLVRLAGEDDERLEWATHMIGVARQLERYADHGVDVAEQTLFVATGEPARLADQRQHD